MKLLKVRGRYEEAFARSVVKVDEKARNVSYEREMERIKMAKEDSETVQANILTRLAIPPGL